MELWAEAMDGSNARAANSVAAEKSRFNLFI